MLIHIAIGVLAAFAIFGTCYFAMKFVPLVLDIVHNITGIIDGTYVIQSVDPKLLITFLVWLLICTLGFCVFTWEKKHRD